MYILHRIVWFCSTEIYSSFFNIPYQRTPSATRELKCLNLFSKLTIQLCRERVDGVPLPQSSTLHTLISIKHLLCSRPNNRRCVHDK